MSEMEWPDIGLGTYQLAPEQTYRSVRWALSIGYRHIDTAALYGNEKQVGQAIRDSGISRQQIFVTTKIPPKAIRQHQLKQAIESSLHQLDLGYINLMLLHCPSAKLIQTWEELSRLYCELYGTTLIHYIGVSNYQEIHLKQLEGAHIKPYANQIEVTPFLPRKKLRAYCKKQGIYVVAHSSLTKGRQLNNQQLLEIMTENNEKLTSASLLLKWALQNKIKIIPRSASQKHIFANFNLPSELLSEQMMKCLDNLDCGFATHPQHIG
jgi:diketogulonate reductase-like aldo/keto reductase